MKHAWKKLLAAAVLPCLLAGCGALGGPESEVPSMDHLLGLTQEQRLEDYDYLVQTLGDSYLCMGVRDRDNPEDPSAAIFQAYREMIQESDSDEVFYSAVYSTLFRLGTYGHLWIVEPDMYRAYCEAYEDGGIQDREHWREVLRRRGRHGQFSRFGGACREPPHPAPARRRRGVCEDRQLPGGI